ncbi:helix-turn-helix domain-containing protein [Chitinophaga sp. XS-30]|uniref:helix-turn-helix domain-containing protein n=1 Tax=Chitinophaga sp. XS-30 TaxID=2604421 RepID=UPI0011DCF268|nr:AraC family transcriptional regulator [Chitinophaga sp. XS-30]QEH40624.1 helix-turn-helix transcriptional regulator [Chitinophaga sp. XS-30]
MLRLTHAEIKTLIRIRWYLEDSRNYPIHIPDLPELFSIEENKLLRGFKRLFKVSIHRYYLRQSMLHAKQLIQDGAMIKEAAIVQGYSNTANFSRAYKRFFGYYPSTIDCGNNAGNGQ